MIHLLRKLLTSSTYMEANRNHPQDFTRKRHLTFTIVVLFLINMVKRSLQDELDEFYRLLQGQMVAEQVVTKSAFTQARQKLKHTAFIQLHQAQINYFYEHFEPLKWFGLRLLAIDGSMVDLPNNLAMSEHFGVWHPHAGGTCPKARISQMFDVLNKISVDAVISPYQSGERDLAERHFDHLQLGDLVLLDRGYPAIPFFLLILEKGAHFCARMPIGKWEVVDDFLASGKLEDRVQITPRFDAIKRCRELELPTGPFWVRILKVILPNGTEEILITSLLDTEQYSYDLVKELYQKRWPVEEDYKMIKSRLELENWTGLTVEAIYQDFYATVFTKNFAAILAQPAQQIVHEKTQSRQYRYHANMTNWLSKMKDSIVLLFVDGDLKQLLDRLWKQLLRVIEPFRPNRSSVRHKRVKRKRFSTSYKPIR
jgi:hypothetical protein